MKVVGIDYDSPQDAQDNLNESMYISWFNTSDRMVHAWRNCFAAHCNAREDLNMMEDLGEFEVAWYTNGIGPSTTPGVASSNFDEDVAFEWAPLATQQGYIWKTTAHTGGSTAALGTADANFFCAPDLMDSVKVGSFNGDVWDARFGLFGATLTDAGSNRASIGVIDSYNKANPVQHDYGTDPFGHAAESRKKFGNYLLYPYPNTMKIQPGTSTHFQIPIGGINVMCGIVRLHDDHDDLYHDGSASGGTPDETGNDTATGILTFWIEGWNEF